MGATPGVQRKSAQAIDCKGLNLPRSAEEWSKSAEAIDLEGVKPEGMVGTSVRSEGLKVERVDRQGLRLEW